jgi:hypothetical protein
MNNNQDKEKDPRFLMPILVTIMVIITAALVIPPAHTVLSLIIHFCVQR